MDKEVQFTRPVFNVPISEIHGIDFRANLKLITINTIEEEPSGNKILIKKKIRKMKSHDHANEDAHVKPSQFRVFSYYYYSGINLLKVITSICTSMSNFKLSSFIYHFH